MILVIGALWLGMIVGFVLHAFLFPHIEKCEICPLCRERWESQLDKWA